MPAAKKPIDPQAEAEAAIQLQQDIEQFRKELKAAGTITRALRRRGKDLQRRLQRQERILAQLIATQEGIAMAFRTRVGRAPVDGDLLTPADDARGREIGKALLAKPEGLKN
jgi:predicted RNase H-like nuclease (RuvC/YqgF family)